MKQTQEFDGKNIDHAVEKACSSLNVSKKNLVYDVISSGSTGIFGIVGVKKARIRVTLPEKDKSAAGGKSTYDSDMAGVMSIVDEAFAEPQKKVVTKEKDTGTGNGTHSPEDTSKETECDPSQNKSPRNETDSKSKPANRSRDPRKKGFKQRAGGQEKKSDESSTSATPLSSENDNKPKPKTYHKKSRPRKKPNASRRTEFEKNGAKQDMDASASRDVTPDASDNLSESPNCVANGAVGKGAAGNGGSAGTGVVTDPVVGVQCSGDVSDSSHTEVGRKSLDEATGVGPTFDPTSGYFADGIDDAVGTGAQLDDVQGHGAFDGNAVVGRDGALDEAPQGDAMDGDAGDDSRDDDVLEPYDDRDEGYPPKYKGEIPVDVSEAAIQMGRETLQKMVSLITEDATVTAQTDEDRLLLRVEGGNSGVLIGRRGQTLEAMQFLTDKIINRCSESRVRLKVDIEGYMETRKANLQSLAYKMADKAKKTGKPATINQMTAQDRRIVHLALKDDFRVRTQSMGDGYYRRLVIFPKKGSYKRRKNFRN